MKMNNPLSLLFRCFGNNPNMQRALQMSEGKSASEIEQVIKNICKQRGIDYEEVKNTFDSKMKGIQMPNMR